jgi:hypothetical protein
MTMARSTPRPRNGRCRSRAIPVPKADGEHHAEQRVPARVLDAVHYLRIWQKRRRSSRADEVVGRGERVGMEEGLGDGQHRRVDGERADENDERRHHGVGEGAVPPPPLPLDAASAA